MIKHTLEQAPDGVPHLLVPDAAHHLFLDQPLAVVAALRALLSAWPNGGRPDGRAPGGGARDGSEANRPA